MGVRFPGQGSNQPFTAQLANAVETLIFTSNPLNISLDFQQILIFGMFMWVSGATVTGTVFRIRRGPLVTSPLVTSWNVPLVTAANTQSTSWAYFDTPGAVAGIQYTITGQQTGGSSNSTNQDGALIVIAL